MNEIAICALIILALFIALGLSAMATFINILEKEEMHEAQSLATDTPVDIGDGLSGWKVYRCHDGVVDLYRNRGQGRSDTKTVPVEQIKQTT
jgi:hypothetical protein